MALRVHPVPDDLGFRRLAFEQDGFVTIPGALSHAEVAVLRRAVRGVYERRTRSPEALHLLAFLGEAQAFVDLLDHRATIPIVAQVLGDNIYCYHCHLDVHPGQETPREGWMWHQDGGVMNRDLESAPRPRMSVKVAFFLTDVSADGRGNMLVVPGSQRSDRMQRPGDGRIDLPDAQPVLARAGDAMMFDRRLWHMRSANTSERVREVLFYAYTYRWVRPRDDMHVPAEMRTRATPSQRQLLGDAESTIDHWMPDLTPPPLRARLEELRSS